MVSYLVQLELRRALSRTKSTANECHDVHDAADSSLMKNPGECLRILVVDDAATNRKMLVRLLENRGHECDQAEDGQQAVEKVSRPCKRALPTIRY